MLFGIDLSIIAPARFRRRCGTKATGAVCRDALWPGVELNLQGLCRNGPAKACQHRAWRMRFGMR